MKRYLFILLSLTALTACGSVHDIGGENHGNISIGDSGLVLTQSEHVTGWGEADCFLCHNTENIHQTDRTGTGLNLDAIEATTREEGLSSCTVCHGGNGV